MAFAFVFPGQGSQSVGMMAAYGDEKVIRDTFDEASAALGEDLFQLVLQGPASALALTVNTQPLMLAAGVAVFRLWREAGGAMPAWMAGHSLGEYAALVAAGALTLADATALVRLRAQAMQEAVPEGEGGMAAILGLEVDVVEQACNEAAEGEVVCAANLNAPGQIVIAGTKAAVARAIDAAKKLGARRAMALPVSAPFHCALMRPAAEKLQARLQEVEISTPQVAVVNNVDVAAPSAPDDIRDALVRQAFLPVRWIELVQWLAHEGANPIIECGPGKVLAGMNKRIAPQVGGAALADAQSVQQWLHACALHSSDEENRQ